MKAEAVCPAAVALLPRRLLARLAALLLVSGISCGLAAEQVETTAAAAKAALEQRQYTRAEALYRQLLRTQPDSPELLTNLGIAQKLQGKSAAAIHSFERALRQRELPGTYALLAAEKCRSRDLEGVPSMLKKILDEQPKDTRALSIVAGCYLEVDDPLDGIAAYEALLTDHDFPPDLAMIQLTKCYLDAARFFFQQLKAAPGNTKYIEAIQRARDDEAPNARGAFALAAQSSSFFDESFNFQQALEVWRQHPTDAAVLYQLSVLSGEESMGHVQLCESKYPASPYLQQLIADILADQGREEEAVAKYESLLAEHPELPGLRYSLGMMYMKQQQWQRALAVFREQLHVDPVDEQAAARVSEALLELQDYKEMKEFLRPRIATVDPPLWARLDLATAEQKLGDLRAAIAQLTAAERDNPTRKTIHYRLMRLYTSTGDKANAARESQLFRAASQ